jgi:uncharacterized membrane protein
MPDETNPALILTAVLLGSMIFFAAIVTPAVFRFLERENAAAYLRGLFPRYYLWGAVVGVLAAAAAWPSDRVSGIILAVVATAFLAVRQLLLPPINIAREGRAAGNEAASRRFSFLHRLSVIINLAQMIALVVVLVL